MACEDYISPEGSKRFKKNADSANEFVTSTNETFTDQDGGVHFTVDGAARKVDGAIEKLFLDASPVNMSPVIATEGQTDFFIGPDLNAVQVNRDGTIEQVNAIGQSDGVYTYDKSTGYVILNQPANAGERFQFSYNLLTGNPSPTIKENSIAYLDKYRSESDTDMLDAWERMLTELGISSNQTSYSVKISLSSDSAWINKRPLPLYRGMTVDFDSAEMIDRADDPSKYYYRRQGLFYSNVDTGVPVRNTFVTGDIQRNQASIEVDNVSQVEIGDYAVIDLWDNGYDSTRDYSSVPVSEGWGGHKYGIHPHIQRIVKVEDIIGNVLVIDYRFGWELLVASKFPALKRNGNQYKGLKTELYLDGIWDGTTKALNPYDLDCCNNVRFFKPSELPIDIVINKPLVKDECTAGRVTTPGAEVRWDKYARYFWNAFYSYGTTINGMKLSNEKMGGFLGVYNSDHKVIYSSIDYDKRFTLTGGEGYMTNGARGHNHLSWDNKQVGGRHIHDSTGGSNMLIGYCESIYESGGAVSYDTHGRFEHDITYLECRGSTIGLAINGRISFGGMTSNIKVIGGSYTDIFGYSENLSISDTTQVTTLGATTISNQLPGDLNDTNCNLQVGLLKCSATVSGNILVACEPRFLTQLDSASGDYYDHYVPKGSRTFDFKSNGQLGIFLTDTPILGGRLSYAPTLSINGGKVWYSGDGSVGVLEIVNCKDQFIDTIFDRVELRISGRLSTSKIKGLFRGDYLFGNTNNLGIAYSDVDEWGLDNTKGISINLSHECDFNGEGSRAFSVRRGANIGGGTLRVRLKVNGVEAYKPLEPSLIYNTNIAYSGGISNCEFTDYSFNFVVEGGAPSVQPNGFKIHNNNYVNCVNNDTDSWVKESNLNFSFSASSIPAGGEVRALIPSSYEPIFGDSVVVNMNNLDEGCAASVYYDNTTDNKFKVKIVNSSAVSKSVLSTIGTVSYLRG